MGGAKTVAAPPGLHAPPGLASSTNDASTLASSEPASSPTFVEMGQAKPP
jgi:hypothetical protein